MSQRALEIQKDPNKTSHEKTVAPFFIPQMAIVAEESSPVNDREAEFFRKCSDTMMTMTILRRFVTPIALGIVCQQAIGQTIPEAVRNDVQRIISFVYRPTAGGEISAGTGFFVRVDVENAPGRSLNYLVTARHVLFPPNEPSPLLILIRLNTREGSAELVRVPLDDRPVFTHPEDQVVDLVAIPARLDIEKFDFRSLGPEQLTTRDVFEGIGIAEGSNVFFSGLFTPQADLDRIYPIFRFGRVAMLPGTPLRWGRESLQDLYLIETQSFGGNSGSPVFAYADSGPQAVRFVGVIKGTFESGEGLEVQGDLAVLQRQNLGISAVIPSYLLRDVLFSAEAVRHRQTLAGN